ncbi:helix-turn-helix domain-containing protein [Streptomyces sp. ISL-10]|uniref:PucR family transcriptional regulator n=1 Tax=Streptomyces sp. ISL-10 TaxID=2819172 RepID=UPI001BE56ED7|nr:PucR family transcriptional regulator [Streptomyces sp. ISL-10]MBT2366597.1 helix-turn-helix domain-containing protein [Streptomyces sp. ISL-10]
MPHVLRSRVRALPAPSAAPQRSRSLVDAEALAALHRAAQVLLDDLAGLTSSLVAELREQEPAYRAMIDADASGVWQEVHLSLRHSIESMIRPREMREAARLISRRIGASRAEQGMPLDALLHAFRLGGAMVWQGLVDETARRHPEDMRLLVHVAADVWTFVDEHCRLVAEAYHQTERQLAWRRENRVRLMTEALLEGATRITDLPEVAATLALPEAGRYAVVAVSPGAPAVHAPPALPAGTRALWHASEDGELAIVLLDADSDTDRHLGGHGHPAVDASVCTDGPWAADGHPDTDSPARRDTRPDPDGHPDTGSHPHPDGRRHMDRRLGAEAEHGELARPEPPRRTGTGAPTTPAELAARLDVPPGVRVGISPAVTGLAAVGEARGYAEIALRACPRDGGVVLLDEHLPAALVVTSPNLGRALADRVLGPLGGIDPADRQLLVETLTAWLRSDGSAQRAAKLLYCHRNTVLNRLRRFEQLTGRSLSRPSDAVEVSLALTAARLLTT